MTTLTVWKFDSESGACRALQVLERLQTEELLQVVDAAVVTWPGPQEAENRAAAQPRRGRRARRRLLGPAVRAALFIPLIGMAIGAAMGALAGSMTDVGIRKVRDEVTPGASALFVMSANVLADRVLGEFKGTGAHLAPSNLSTEQEAKLREVFAEDEAQTPAG